MAEHDKPRSFLSLVPEPRSPVVPDRSITAALRPAGPLSSRQLLAIEDRELSQTVMLANRDLGETATIALRSVVVTAGREFSRGVGELLDIRDAAKPGEHRDVVTMFSNSLLSEFSQQAMGLLSISAANMARELSREIHPPAPGFLARLFGLR